jgi:coenzyme F420-0:L-glutamate ligase
MKISPIRTRIFRESDDLTAFITAHIPSLQDGDVLAVTSKIVALSEGRTAVLNNPSTKDALIREESTFALPTRHVWLTITNGMLMPNAGIDESNADGKLILLPRDSFRSARVLRRRLGRHFGIRHLGILITDSRTLPMRSGVTGVALGYAGFRGLRDERGKQDIFGRRFVYTRVNVADGLAAAAVLTMGETHERCPLAIIEDANVAFQNRIHKDELAIPAEEDMYAPILDI